MGLAQKEVWKMVLSIIKIIFVVYIVLLIIVIIIIKKLHDKDNKKVEYFNLTNKRNLLVPEGYRYDSDKHILIKDDDNELN